VIISHHHPALHKWSYWCVENGELKEREHGPDQPDAA
jgi:hypothetical protein